MLVPYSTEDVKKGTGSVGYNSVERNRRKDRKRQVAAFTTYVDRRANPDDRRLYLPVSWTEDRYRSLVAETDQQLVSG